MTGIWIAGLAGLCLAAAGLLYCCCVATGRADEAERKLLGRKDNR